MHSKGESPVAFVEFQDVRFATDAMNRLQGCILLSSERGGIRIEYARNKMGEPLLFQSRAKDECGGLSASHSPVSLTAFQ